MALQQRLLVQQQVLPSAPCCSSGTQPSLSSIVRVPTGCFSTDRGRAGMAYCSSTSSSGSSNPQRSPADELAFISESLKERRKVDQSEKLMENPYAPVESAMTSPVVTTTADTVIGTILDQFEHFTGLPVVDERGRCIGIISNIDIFRHLQQKATAAGAASSRVSEVMSSPAVVIMQHAPIAYAAGLMLKHKVHRLPVVDGENVVVGILTRTDIYQPLLPGVNPMYHRLVGLSEDQFPNF